MAKADAKLPQEFAGEEFPKRYLLVAAADHCLAAAYQGRCPGVDPDELMRWRIATRAKFQNRSEAELLADVERAREAIQAKWADLNAFRSHMARTDDDPPEDSSSLQGVIDMRGSWIVCRGCGNVEPGLPPSDTCPKCNWPAETMTSIPELPEAAAREGLAFIATVRAKDGRMKVVLQSASPEQVKWFLASFPAKDKYGDPARGFAGGYE